MAPFDPFWGIFDLNKDGRTDIGEEIFGYLVLSELEDRKEQRQLEEESRRHIAWDDLD